MWPGQSQRRREQELAEELRAHLTMDAAEKEASGMSAEEAARAARRELGNLTRATEETRATWAGAAWLEFWRDLRFGARLLGRDPSFALVATLVLALGIGASSAVFTLVDGLLLRPLPFDQPEQLVVISETMPAQGHDAGVVSPANFIDWQEQSRSFSGIAVGASGPAAVVDDGDPAMYIRRAATGDLMPLLRVKPALGRLIGPADDHPDAPATLMLSHRLWQERYGGDESIIGRSITAWGASREIVGVLPPNFYLFDRETDLWLPARFDRTLDWRRRAGRFLNAAARLKPDVSISEAEAELKTIAARLEEKYPEFNKGWSVKIVGLKEYMVQDVQASLLALFGGSLLLLLIACTNVANLLLTRAAARTREMAVRGSLGAGRWRLCRQLLTESLLLALTGGALGVLLGAWLVRTFTLLAPQVSGPFEVGLDMRVAAFAVAISVITVIVSSLAPALQAANARTAVLRHGAKSTSRGRLRELLVGGQVAVTALLLVGAGLLSQSFLRLQSQDAGMRKNNLLTFNLTLPYNLYSGEEAGVFWRDLQRRLAEIPGIESVGGVNALPLTASSTRVPVRISGKPDPTPQKPRNVVTHTTLPGYFETTGTPVLKGRAFGERENRPDAPLGFVVNQQFVDQFLAGEDPLAARIAVQFEKENPLAPIIGVVGNQREGSLAAQPIPTVYYPEGKLPTRVMQILVHTAGPPAAVLDPVRKAVQSLDPRQPIANVQTMEEVIDSTMSQERLLAWLSTCFAILSLSLATAGLYGSLSYAVRQTRREIGVRMALGAQTTDVFSTVVRKGLTVVFAGLIVGAVAALGLTRLLAGLLFSIEPLDPATYVGAAGVLALVGFLAVSVPALAAARIQPTRALRYE